MSSEFSDESELLFRFRVELTKHDIKINKILKAYNEYNEIWKELEYKMIIDICKMTVDKQEDILLKTGVLVSPKEIIEKAIIRGCKYVK